MPLADAFQNFAAWCPDTSPLYARLAEGVADDPDLLGLAAATPTDRSPPHLLLAAAHYLLLSGVEHPIARFYPSVVGEDAIGPTDADPVPDFRSFCLERGDEIRDIVAVRRTQTNAVRRTAALLPAFEYVSRAVDRRPLALVEVGPSAGLNLIWDRYTFEYGDGRRYGPREGFAADGAARATIDSELRGDRTPPLPETFPAVASRVGIDLNPLDVTGDADVNWLRALVWPEHVDRHELLRRVVAVARTDPPRLVEGDAVELLPEVLAETPRETPVCLFDTQVRYQFDDDARERFERTVREIGGERPLHWLTGDDSVRDEEAMYLDHFAVVDGELRRTRLAKYQQHGRWVEWLAE